MLNIKIKSEFMPMSFWKEKLPTSLYENIEQILCDGIYPESCNYTYNAKEILQALCEYEGGVYAHTALYFIKEAYGIELD